MPSADVPVLSNLSSTASRTTRIRVLGSQMLVVNFLVAALIWMIHGGRFGHTLVYSECIGIAIWGLVETGRQLLPKGPHGWPIGWRTPALLAAACAAGYACGITTADAIFGYSSWRDYLGHPGHLLGDLGPTVAFCLVVAAGFYVRGLARNERERAAAAVHEATLARLTLLQSQLEPHMLFNTLANLRALIAADPQRAQEMLDRLIAFLRATLAASRLAEHPLADEFARIADYLALMQVRMGDRLHASLALPPGLAAIAVPPLLLQPLVENAIKHGLEPQRGAGELRVEAALDGTTLLLVVADSGRGLEAAAAARTRDPVDAGSGFGLAQIRERLHTLHGDAATFTLAPRAEGGTRAEIRLPLRTRPASTESPRCPPP